MRTMPMPRPVVDVFGPDVRPLDLVLGGCVALAVVAGGGLGVATMSHDPPALDSTPLVAEHEVAVAVRPVSTAPGTAAQGITSDAAVTGPPSTDAPSSLPPTRASAGSPAQAREPLGPGPAATAVAPRPDDAPPPTPGALPRRPEGGIKSLPRLAPPRTDLHGLEADAPAEPGFGVGGPGVAPGTADPATSPDDPYAYVDPSLEHPEAGEGEGGAGLVGGGGEESTDGDGDPLAARAVAAYRQRLQRWLSTDFVVTGTGLGSEQLSKLSVKARIKLDADRTVVDYAVEGKPHPALAAAARTVLGDVKGQQAPPLPAHYPGPLQPWIRVTFVCTEDRCD